MSDERASSEGSEGSPIDDEVTARNTRLLKRTVYIMGVLLVAGAVVLIGAIVWKASRLPVTAPGGFEPLDVVVSAGAAVRSVDIVGDRMAVAVDGPDGSEIIIIDLRRGEIGGRVRLKPAAPAPE